jgi:hypothetical protein
VRRSLVAEGAALAVLPALFLIAEFLFRAHGTPYWLWFNLDPSYAYLMSGMEILEGLPPGHVDHPGTPVQCIVALVVWLSGAGSPGTAVGASAFTGAEAILARTSDALFALDAAAMLVLGWTVWRRFGALVPALAAEGAPFVTMLALRHGIDVKPEPMLLCATLLLAAAMVEEAFAPRHRSLVAMAAAGGFGTACKISFAPLALAPFILVAPARRRAALVALTAVAFVIFIAPALPRVPYMLHWVGSLAVGSGAYGSGPETVINPERYPVSFEKLFFGRPIFIVVWLLGAAALYARRGERGPGERLLFATLAAELAQILVVAKHPSAHYALPAYEMSAPAAAFLWLVAREIGYFRRRAPAFARGFAGILLAVGAAQTVAVVGQGRELARESEGSLSIDLARDFPACARVYRDLASSPSLAWIDNRAYGAPFAARLAAMAPADDYYSFSWFGGGIETWQGPVAPAALAARYPCVALRGTGLAALRAVAATFGAYDRTTEVCVAGSEYVLAENAPCPKGTRIGG